MFHVEHFAPICFIIVFNIKRLKYWPLKKEVSILAILAKSKFRHKRVFQMGFCTDGYVEIYEIKPHPEEMGAFFLAYRQKWARKITQLYCGLTAGGAKSAIKAFNKRRIDLTALLQEIEFKSGDPRNITPLLLLKNG